MRTLLAGFATIVCLGLANPARADWRMFIVVNDSDDYGIDRCLANHEKCGVTAANAYCKSREYVQADSFRRADRDEITGAVPDADSAACRGRKCGIVAIICTR